MEKKPNGGRAGVKQVGGAPRNPGERREPRQGESMLSRGEVAESETTRRWLFIATLIHRQGKSEFQSLGHRVNTFTYRCPWLTLTLSLLTQIPRS